MIPFDTTPSGSTLLDRIFDRVQRTLDSLAKAVTNDRLVGVSFTAANTDTQVRHGIGAVPLTWEVVDRDADVNVWRSDTINATPRDTIILRVSGAPCTVLVRFN